MVFRELPSFERRLYDYLDEDEYHSLQLLLLERPKAGVVIPGAGGLRKLRWGSRRKSSGKRGGVRIVYYHHDEKEQIWLFMLYAKGEVEELMPGQKKAFKAALEHELREQ